MSTHPLALLARPPARVAETLDAHLALHQELVSSLESSVARALVAGHAADRLGHAFASGYLEALGELAPRVRGACASLAVTEKGGGHPRAIETRAEAHADGYVLHGEKAFVTLVDLSELALVVAKEGERSDGTPVLGVFEVPLSREGVRVELLPETPFAPEMRHGKMILQGVRLSRNARLPGDGYREYVKRFRTVEDLHVLAAATGHRLALTSRFDLGEGDLRAGLGIAAAVLGLAGAHPDHPATHLALDRLYEEARRHATLDEAALQRLEPEVRARYVRDLPLFQVAEGPRRKRAERAAAALTGR